MNYVMTALVLSLLLNTGSAFAEAQIKVMGEARRNTKEEAIERATRLALKEAEKYTCSDQSIPNGPTMADPVCKVEDTDGWKKWNCTIEGVSTCKGEEVKAVEK